MMKPNVWSTHLPHFFDEKGNVATGLPLETQEFITTMGTFVMYATDFDGDAEKQPRCFNHSENEPCQGNVLSFLQLDDEEDRIYWECEACHSYGFISGWQNTLWDLSETDNHSKN